jgi:uncharacterized protein
VRLEDSFTVKAPIDTVWRAIIDPIVVGACLPGCREIVALSPTSYKASIGVELGPIKTVFNVQVEIRDQAAPRRMATVTRGEEGTRASMVSADSTLELDPLDDGTTAVRYTSEVSVVGRLGKFGLGVMRKKAEALGRTFAENFRARVEQAAAA